MLLGSLYPLDNVRGCNLRMSIRAIASITNLYQRDSKIYRTKLLQETLHINFLHVQQQFNFIFREKQKQYHGTIKTHPSWVCPGETIQFDVRISLKEI